MADYFESGFAVHEPSWHAKENLLMEAPDLSTWREFAGLEWEPVKVPLYLPARKGRKPMQSGTFIVARNDRLDLLDDPDPDHRDLAILNRSASDEYVPIEHERDMEPLLAELFAAAKAMGVEAEFTTAGSVREGKQVYACLMLSKPIRVNGDPSLTLPYAVILNGHGGSTSCRGGLTVVRVVCANTYAISEYDLDGHEFSFRIQHTGDVESRLEETRRAIAGWLDALDGYKQRMDYLSDLTVGDDQVAHWLDEFMPIDEKRMTDRQITNRRVEHETFMRLWQGGENDGRTVDGIQGTGYGLWMTTIEYMDHFVPWKNPDSYLRRTMLKPVDAKRLAAARIQELAESGVS